MKIQGNAFLLDRPNVDTDQIIPAVYLTGVSIEGLGKHLFEGVPDFDREIPEFKNATILVARENFGCGSSREHAVWALEDHGFKAVIAPSFARIFRQNMFNRGLLAIELPLEAINEICQRRWQDCLIDLEKMSVMFWHDYLPDHPATSFGFSLDEFSKILVLQGGLVGFVASRY